MNLAVPAAGSGVPAHLWPRLQAPHHACVLHAGVVHVNVSPCHLPQVWEFPRIFGRDFRRHIRKFQYLGLYGLPPVGSQRWQQQQQRVGDDCIGELAGTCDGGSSSSDEASDTLQWLMMSVQ